MSLVTAMMPSSKNTRMSHSTLDRTLEPQHIHTADDHSLEPQHIHVTDDHRDAQL